MADEKACVLLLLENKNLLLCLWNFYFREAIHHIYVHNKGSKNIDAVIFLAFVLLNRPIYWTSISR